MKKKALLLSIIFSMSVFLLSGCTKTTGSREETGNKESQSEEETVSSSTAVYDAAAQTMTVTGTGDYQKLVLGDDVASARILKVEDDAFELSVYLPVLRNAGWNLQEELAGFIERTDRSFSFMKQYLKKHAETSYPEDLGEKRIVFKIDRNNFDYEINEDEIVLRTSENADHRDFLYVLALLNAEETGWEHFGYAWYVGTCINPYQEPLQRVTLTAEAPYYQICADAGMNMENMTEDDIRIMNDAVSRLCFKKGLTHWGSYCESAPVTRESIYRRKTADPGDRLLSAFMAASFLGWLDKACGFDQVSLFCFGKQSFEESFNMDFDSAYEAWKAWIIENYPISE